MFGLYGQQNFKYKETPLFLKYKRYIFHAVKSLELTTMSQSVYTTEMSVYMLTG